MVLLIDEACALALTQSGSAAQVIATAFYGSDQTIPSSKYPNLDSVPITTDGS